MTKRHFRWWSLALLALTVAATAWMYPALPATVPIHWNAAGQANGFGPRISIFLEPLLIGLLALGWPLLPSVSPAKFQVEGFERTWWFGGMVVTGLLAYVQGLLLAMLAHGGVDLGRALLGGIGLAVVLLGNVLGKVRRNFWLGVRTPWTLASERVWYATHRLAGKTMVAGGLLVLVVAAAGLPPYLGTAALLAGALAPVLFSLLYYKRLERGGGA